MKKIFKKIFSLYLAVAICAGITVTVGVNYENYAVAAVDYYASITATEGDLLLGQVHDLITTTHKTYTTYVDCKTTSLVIQTDRGTEDNTIMDFYTQKNISAPWNGGTSAGTWNREHVWCQSLSGGLWGQEGGGSDMHHLRPSEVKLNATRGNNKFGEVIGGTAAYYIDTNGNNKYVGGYVKGATFEPLDEVKGDVARIVLYVYTHYNTYGNVGGTTNGNGSSYYFGALNFTQIMSAGSESAAIELLIKWNEEDPVDEIELARNDAVYSIQGNRNPFIDHPEYVEAIWGDTSTDNQDPDQDKDQDQDNDQDQDQDKDQDQDNDQDQDQDKDQDQDNDQDQDQDQDQNKNQNVEKFHNAVVGISDNSTPDEMFNSINTAIAAYRNLSEEEKAEASSDIAALQKAITDYNNLVDLYNSAANGADKAALGGLGITF